MPIFARYFAGTVAYQLVGDGLPNWEAGGHFMLPGLVHIPERTPKMAEARFFLQGVPVGAVAFLRLFCVLVPLNLEPDERDRKWT